MYVIIRPGANGTDVRLFLWNNFRLHGLYGALRIGELNLHQKLLFPLIKVSLFTDLFVIYHAKGLKLTDEGGDEEKNKDEEDVEDITRKKQTSGPNMKTLDREQNEPLNVDDTCCSSVEGKNRRKKEQIQQKSASLPRDIKQSGHKKNASKDLSELLLVSPSEFEAIRKSSNHPITEF
jgi:hypothetical protein